MENGFPVEWSYSNSRFYQACPRAFYYRQQAQTEATTTDSEGSSPQYFPSAGALIGTIVHQCISTQIEEWRDGNPTSMQEAESMAAELLDGILSSDSSTIATGQPIDRESVLGTVRSHLQRIFRVIWPQVRPHKYIMHEKTVSFEVDERTVWVRPDLCTRDPDGNLIVIDWKTTSSDPFERESVQLLVYGLWAYHAYEPDFARIKVRLAHTADGNLELFPFGESEYQRIRDIIDQQTTYWSTHDALADYPPRPEETMCEACSFLDECEAGQEFLTE